MYQRAWVVFHQFYAQFYACTDPQVPLPLTCIPLFISYLSFRKLASSTIKSYLSAISYVHKLKGLHDPTKSFLVEKLLTALSRQQPLDIHLPITRPVLHGLLHSLSFSNSSAFQRSLFSAMFLVAFYGLFRIGELATKSTRFASSVIQYSDLSFSFGNDPAGPPQGAKITTYKGHSFRIGGACHAAEKGYSYAQIRALGRWKSDAFKTYLRSEILYANSSVARDVTACAIFGHPPCWCTGREHRRSKSLV